MENFKGTWIHDSPFINKFRPDYRNDDIKIIVEFDGHSHYTQAARILADCVKDRTYEKAGYTIIRIPYFIQLSSSTCTTLFNTAISIKQEYPHGFIDKKCTLPADFCEAGLERFKADLFRFKNEARDIIESLKIKISEAKYGKSEVIPKSLEYLLD